MEGDTFLTARFLYHNDVLAAIVVVELLYGFTLHFLVLAAAEIQHIVFSESFCKLFSRHTEIQGLLPLKQSRIPVPQFVQTGSCFRLLFLRQCFDGQLCLLAKYHSERGFQWFLARHSPMEDYYLSTCCKVLSQSR